MKTIRILRAGVIMTALLLGTTLAQAQGTQLLVSNVQAQQRQFTATWDVTYDLETVGDIAVTVSLYLSTDSGASYPNLCATVSGDFGAGVVPGTGKSIVWDAGADFPGLSSATCRLRVTADDGRADFVAIAPGTFMMGSPTTGPGRGPNETQHQVTLTHGIYVQTTEVTNQQYRDMAQWAFNNSHVTATSASLRDALDASAQELLDLDRYSCEISFSNARFTVDAGKENHPVSDVTWYGAVAYCDWLSLRQGLSRAYNHNNWECNAGNPYTAPGYRLPTEAEWEYACRAGTQTPFNTGSCLDAGTEANYYGSDPYPGCPAGPYLGGTAPVGSYPANAFGLYDMHGNLHEWCNDWSGTYGGTVTDPVGAGAASFRVLRDGYWYYNAQYCRSAARSYSNPDYSGRDVGFRPVRSVF